VTTYSSTNGRLGGALAVVCLVLCVLDGLAGRVPMAGLFGFLGVLLALQSLDDLFWQGAQDAVVVPLKRVLIGLVIGCAVWGLYDLLR
jgi:hypothetical protein